MAPQVTGNKGPFVYAHDLAASIDIRTRRFVRTIKCQISGPQHLTDTVQISRDSRGNLTIMGEGVDLGTFINSPSCIIRSISSIDGGSISTNPAAFSAILNKNGRVCFYRPGSKLHIKVFTPVGTQVYLQNVSAN